MAAAIKSAIFDLGGVIVPCDFARGYAAIEKLCPYAAKDIPRRIATSDLVHRFETGRIDAPAFFEELRTLLDLDLEYDHFHAVWTSVLLPDAILPESLFRELKSRGLRLLALSNTNAIHYPTIRDRYPALKWFDGAVLSYEVGALKPAPEIYRAAISAAACEASECFFTDDSPVYVDGAKRAGIDAVQFLSPGQLMNELRLRGMLA